MTSSLDSTASTTLAASAEDALKARDRVLLYTRGMSLRALPSIELALEAMRRAAAQTTAGAPTPVTSPQAMRELFAILQVSGATGALLDPAGEPLASMPPLKRRYMIAEPLTMPSPFSALKRLVGFTPKASS